MSQKQVQCPDCGDVVAACGLESHRNGRWCAIKRNQIEVVGMGHAFVSPQRAKLVERILPKLLGPARLTNVHAGYKGRRSRETWSHTVPAWLNVLLTSRDGTTPAQRDQMAVAAARDPELRGALLAAIHMEAAPPVLLALVEGRVAPCPTTPT